MKKLIVIRGALGVGKSTISKIVASKLNAEYILLDHIITDNRLDSDNGIPLENFIKSNDIVLKQINNSKNKLFILDGCFYYSEQIKDLKQKFKDEVIFITLKGSLQKCIERDSYREKVYGKDSATFVFNMTEGVKVGYEIWNENLTIDETVKKVLEYIQNA